MRIAASIFYFIVILGCSSSKQLETKPPFTFGDVYYQAWVAGIQEGGSGVNVYIPIEDNPKSIVLDSIYFRNQAVKLKKQIVDKTIYIGRFQSQNKQDLIMSSDLKDEYGNTLPKQIVKPPFPLTKNECIVSYQDKGKTKYYKIQDLIEKQPLHYPATPPNKE
ncbi:hypothetical protein [Mangrovimonas spongiae]|uniref:Lipoprotein n=1 Tax=Mangrovimonas spongiae TaxID=2494697 RepID=A0A428K4Y8_9FLAO|nr:hypothetical protein [Mangrovimonas spongiae]RSK41479.1 hypothetical protein EJA19_00980 [Mangrovimonas spongiae]